MEERLSVERSQAMDGANVSGGSSGILYDESDMTRSSLLSMGKGAGSGGRQGGGDGRITARSSSLQSGDIIEMANGGEFPRDRKRILILMSDTGGGHRASGEALRAAFEELYGPQQETHMVDFWIECAGFPFTVIPGVYSFAQRNPSFWKFLYWFGQFGPTRGFTDELFNVVAHRKVKKALVDFDADVIVSVHPMVQNLSLRVLRRIERYQEAPYAIVITDFGDAHPMWFHELCDTCYVPTNAIRGIAIDEGLEEEQVREFGLPVRSDFWEPLSESKDALRQRLGLKAGLPTVLIVSGGDGAVGLEKVAIAVADAIGRKVDGEGQMVVICGRNESVRDRLCNRPWEIPVVIQGFVTNMGDWMGACDCIVTKAGPGTIAEALIRGLPMVLSYFLPGQEEGNVDFVIEHRVGVYCPRSRDIGETVADWFADPEILGDMSTRAKSLGRPQASREIAKDIWKVLRASRELNLGVRRTRLDAADGSRKYRGRTCGRLRSAILTYPARIAIALLFIILLVNFVVEILHMKEDA